VDYCLARAEPVEYIPGPDEKLSSELSVDNGVNMLSMSTAATGLTNLLPTAE